LDVLWEIRKWARSEWRRINANRFVVDPIAIPVRDRNIAGGDHGGHPGVTTRSCAATVIRICGVRDVARARKGGRIRGILVCPTVEQVLAHIEHEGHDREHQEQSAREQEKDLPGLGLSAISC
jgi:hypothetical protein